MIHQNAELHNVEDVVPAPDGDGLRLRRVPSALWTKLNAQAQKRAHATAGCEIRFNLQSGSARIVLKYVEDRGESARERPVLVEIYHGDFFARCVRLVSDWTEISISPPDKLPDLAAAAGTGPVRFDVNLVRLVLPYMPEIRLRSIEGDIAPPLESQCPSRRYLAYGSSITNGAFATRPGETYPALVARSLGVDHINLGFGGGAHLEPEMAAWIAKRSDWDFASLELGINLLGRCSTEEFRERVAGFLPRIANAHRSRWIFCIDLFSFGGDLRPNGRGEEFRLVVHEAVMLLNSPRVVHIDGRQLLTRMSGLTLDLTHPSSDGFAEIAATLAAMIRSTV